MQQDSLDFNSANNLIFQKERVDYRIAEKNENLIQQSKE